MSEDKSWYMSSDEGPQGPYSAEEICAFRAAGQVADDRLVWREGFPEWRRLVEIPELRAAKKPDSAANRKKSPLEEIDEVIVRPGDDSSRVSGFSATSLPKLGWGAAVLLIGLFAASGPILKILDAEEEIKTGVGTPSPSPQQSEDQAFAGAHFGQDLKIQNDRDGEWDSAGRVTMHVLVHNVSNLAGYRNIKYEIKFYSGRDRGLISSRNASLTGDLRPGDQRVFDLVEYINDSRADSLRWEFRITSAEKFRP